MTKEELEKETAEYFKSICGDYNEEYERTGKRHYWVGFDIKNAYLAGAEPREKQIQIDAEQIRALQKQNGELTDELKALRESIKDYGAGCYENGLRNGKRKLEEQIEKMKNCKNCNKLKKEKDGLLVCTVGSFYTNVFGKNCDKWELED